MTQATVLIYHMNGNRLRQLESVCRRMNIRPLEIEPGMGTAPIGLLSGMLDPLKLMSAGGPSGREIRGPQPIDEEMIVMAGFNEKLFNSFLDRLKENGVRVSLKAVQTDTNLYWSGEMLQAELKREREIYSRMSKRF